MPQTSYSQYMLKAYPGMVADVQYDNHIESKLVETAAIAPGIAVSRGTDAERQVEAGGVAPVGVVVRDLAHENNASSVLEYAVGDAVGVMTSGQLWIELVNTGAPGDGIYSVDADGTIGAGVAGAGQTQLVGTLETTVSVAGGLGRIKLGEQGN